MADEGWDLQSVADSFWARLAEGVHFPQEWHGRLSLDQAYQVQLEVMRRKLAAGGSIAGWKVGLTSAVMQRQFSVHEPCFGNILGGDVFQSGAALPFDSLTGPAVEHELCFEMAHDLVGPGVTDEAARAAILAVRPAIETPETRGDFTKQLELALADNAQERAIVVGEPAALADIGDLRKVAVSVAVNGELTAEGTGDAILGDPIRSVTWLANKLAAFGQHVGAGQLVMAGSLTRQLRMSKGDGVVADYGALGVVRVSFP